MKISSWNITATDGQKYYAQIQESKIKNDTVFTCYIVPGNDEFAIFPLEFESFPTYQNAFNYIFNDMKEKYGFYKRSSEYFCTLRDE